MSSKLVLDPMKVSLAMANECINPYELCEKMNIHYSSYLRITKGQSVKPATAGKVAKALNVKVQDLLKD